MLVGTDIRTGALRSVGDADNSVRKSGYQNALVDQRRADVVSGSEIEITRVTQFALNLTGSLSFIAIALALPAVTRFVVGVLYGVEIGIGRVVVRLRVVVALLRTACVSPAKHGVPVSGRTSGCGRVAIKLVFRNMEVNALIRKDQIVVDIVLVALKSKATARLKNHVMICGLLDAPGVPIKADAVTGSSRETLGNPNSEKASTKRSARKL